MSICNKPFPQMEQKRYNSLFANIQLVIACFLIAIFGLNTRIAHVPSLSMYPTLDINEYLFCVKTDQFQYGDIVLFHPPIIDDSADVTINALGGGDAAPQKLFNKQETFVKRVIGKGGDTIRVHNGVVWRNGEALDEPYIAAPIQYEMDEILVPDGYYFVMGDNRNRSFDSHDFGPVPAASIYNKCVFHCNPPILLGLQDPS